MSFFKNFGKFESLIAFNNNKSSFYYGFYFFKNPAIVNTLLTALIPKS